MIDRTPPLALSSLFALACFIATACDDSCEPKALSDLCGSKCPKNLDEAVERVCASDGGQPHGDGWAERKNDCGGTNVENTGGGWGASYSFDGAGKLVGGVTWSDTDDGPCNSFDTYYGKRCQGSGYIEHECPGGS